jgi:hypothetical protein
MLKTCSFLALPLLMLYLFPTLSTSVTWQIDILPIGLAAFPGLIQIRIRCILAYDPHSAHSFVLGLTSTPSFRTDEPRRNSHPGQFIRQVLPK